VARSTTKIPEAIHNRGTVYIKPQKSIMYGLKQYPLWTVLFRKEEKDTVSAWETEIFKTENSAMNFYLSKL